MYLIFDTETTGLPKNYQAPISDLDNWPRVVQLAWQLHQPDGSLLSAGSHIIRPDGFTIPYNAEKVHGISTEMALNEGKPLAEVLGWFLADMQKAIYAVGHNIEFDINIVGAELLRAGITTDLVGMKRLDTMQLSTDFVAIPGKGSRYQYPSLTKLHQKLFGVGFDDAHDAAYDVDATARCFFALIKEGVIPPAEGISVRDLNYQPPALDEANFAKRKAIVKPEKKQRERKKTDGPQELITFTHLHVHSDFSILQSTASVKALIYKAKEMKMPGIAITDLGNLHAAFTAVSMQEENFKVIIGCEFYVAEERKRHQFTKDQPDRRFQQVLIAKNQKGYQNLCKLSSIGFIEGYYAGLPRIDKDLIVQYKEGLIALSGGLQGEIPSIILEKGEYEAEEAFKWWLDVFGDDFYVSLQRHELPEEERVNEVLLDLAVRYNVKPVAAHEAFYLSQQDSPVHDILLCVKDGNQISMPVGRGRSNRQALPNDQFYLKSAEEMNDLFHDLPEALENTNEILAKCSPLKLKRDILLPRFELPEGFETEDDYLRHLTYEGAKKRYPELTPDIRERIDFELSIIKSMGFPGYFLIVQDLIAAARNMGVAVGPGRGSAAGSVVAYCTGITNIDPIRYTLLFERFLNPERVSMPDIDIDFDDRNRQQVIDYVVRKYGKNQVAQIITYGTMAAKMSIKDVARVLELPIDDANKLAGLVPSTPGTTLKKAFDESQELAAVHKSDQGIRGQVVRTAEKLEGRVRNTGIHAAGVIIAPDDLLEYIPVCVAKDADLLVTQFDGKVIESAGMLKMDFLGLKNLTIILDCLRLIRKNRGVVIDIDEIPLEDPKSYELYQKGDTIGTFQFESDGMRQYLKQLKPTNIEDLIAMNALYRPGPMDFIPNYIDRKHGREPVEYPHELLKPILEPTYGIMIYQEQIMQTAQIMAGYSLGGADLLRRAMGKKKAEEMEKQRSTFIKGAKEKHNIPEQKANEVFDIMERFAAYGFNRSHSAAYSVLAFQTGYLKANYPSEYMAALLSNWMGNITKISSLMEECKHLNIKVLGPDVNESSVDFDVNKAGNIRFGLGAIKGAGEAAVEAIIQEREKNGPYKSIWDFLERINLKAVNKKTMESLAFAGAFDGFGEIHRAQFFFKPDGDQTNGLEKLLKYAQQIQAEKSSAQSLLFGGGGGGTKTVLKIPDCEPWPDMVKLRNESEVVGFFISGHPLDGYRLELEKFCVPIPNIERHKGKEIQIGGHITEVVVRQGKNGNSFALFTIEDYQASTRLAAFSETFNKFSHLLKAGEFVVVKGKVQERYGQKDVWELSPSHIAELSTLKSKVSRLEITVALDALTVDLVEELAALFEKHQGNCSLQFEVADAAERIKVDLFSRRLKVSPEGELLKALQNRPGLRCKVG